MSNNRLSKTKVFQNVTNNKINKVYKIYLRIFIVQLSKKVSKNIRVRSSYLNCFRLNLRKIKFGAKVYLIFRRSQ